MLTVEYSRWGQDPDLLRVLGLDAEHPRTRERFLALYQMWGDKSASQIGRETGRHPHPVMDWVHRYNSVGPAALGYQRTGGRCPFLPQPEHKALMRLSARPSSRRRPRRRSGPRRQPHAGP